MSNKMKAKLELRRLQLLDAIKEAQALIEAAAAANNGFGYVGFTGQEDEHLVPTAYLVAAALQWKTDNQQLLDCMPQPKK